MQKNKHKVALITDSTCNIPDELVEKHNILVQPLYVLWGTEELRDQVDIDSPTFYKRLQTDPVHPTTSQPTPAHFAETAKQAISDGAEEVLIICISDELSGTIASANRAEEMVKDEIGKTLHVYNSKATSMGLGWQVLAAARARDEGADLAGMKKAAETVRECSSLTLTVDTLDYLHKGGRIGGASKLIGSMLDLKPQLYVDFTSGILKPGEKTRTRKKAVKHVYNAYFKNMDTSKPMRIAVMHIAAPEEAKKMSDKIKAEYSDLAEIFTVEISPVVGVHVGPGTVGIAGYYEI